MKLLADLKKAKVHKIRSRLHEIIFEADTFEGKLFDVILLILIAISIFVVMFETVESIDNGYHKWLVLIEWIVTILFTIEYILRILTVFKPVKYIFSFFGIIDFLAILPTYLSIFIIGTQYLMIIRALRLLRMFRILKMGNHVKQGKIITASLKASIPKITVFLYFVVLAVIVFGSIMYIVEGSSNPNFDNIPRSIYWAIVTLTTVGYGDIAPVTPVGQFLASLVMIMGYAVIAVPTGIISAEMVYRGKKTGKEIGTQACRYCGKEGHDFDAEYCKYCGHILNK